MIEPVEGVCRQDFLGHCVCLQGRGFSGDSGLLLVCSVLHLFILAGFLGTFGDSGSTGLKGLQEFPRGHCCSVDFCLQGSLVYAQPSSA